MNPQHRNALIAGVNRMMEGLSMIGQALEADGWEGIEDDYALSGPRPVAAARLEEPSFQDAAHAPGGEDANSASEAASTSPGREASLPGEGAAASAPSPAPGRRYELAEVRAFLADLSQQGYTAQVRQLILDAGASALSEVDPDMYGQIMAAARELDRA